MLDLTSRQGVLLTALINNALEGYDTLQAMDKASHHTLFHYKVREEVRADRAALEDAKTRLAALI